MPGTGPAPKESRQDVRKVPTRGDWQTSDGGWQHGDVPKTPTGLRPVSRETWAVWFSAWFAGHWIPEDLPVLRQVIRLYDKIERDEASAAELAQYRQLIDSYGITPKGQQDRRWKRPTEDAKPQPAESSAGRYGHLRAINE